MATLLSIAAHRRDRTEPGMRCRGQIVSMPSGSVHPNTAVAGADRCASLNALTAEYYERWQPVVTEERLLVDLLIAADWQLRRLRAGRPWRPPEPA